MAAIHGCVSLGQPAKTFFISSERTLYGVWKTCRDLWMIETDGERESGKIVLSTGLDNGVDDKQYGVNEFESHWVSLASDFLLN